MLSAETINERQHRHSITDLLHEKITISNVKDTKNEMSLLRFENDMVTTFFDSITKLSDHFTYSFIEELKRDVIIHNIFINLFISLILLCRLFIKELMK